MPPSWQPNFDFYMTRLGDDPASFLVDLGAVPQPSHSLRLHVRVPLLRPRPDGLRDASEFEPMGELEDRLAGTLAAKIDAIYVGRVVARGATEFFFYVPPAAAAALAEFGELVDDPAPYEIGTHAEPDPDWDAYTRFLYPDAWSMQSMMNRRVLQQLEQHGDATTVARTIDHLAIFATKASAEAAAAQLATAGFTTDAPAENDDGRFHVEFHRSDIPGDGGADRFVGEVLDIVLPLEGRYDGWGCTIVSE